MFIGFSRANITRNIRIFAKYSEKKYMDKKTFNLWNRIVALAVFVIACVTYLSTIEPTASFWDCG